MNAVSETTPNNFICPRLHVITDTQCQNTHTHLELAQAALAGGAKLIQYRDKSEPNSRLRLNVAKLIAEECRKADAQLIINDRTDIASLCPGAGLHIGPTDLEMKDARMLLGQEPVIGATVNTQGHALALVEERPSYIGLGPFRASSNKEAAKIGLGLDGMRGLLQETQTCLGSHIPCIAIGGIQVDDVASLLKIGFHGVAVIGAIAQSSSPEAATRSFLQAIEHAL